MSFNPEYYFPTIITNIINLNGGQFGVVKPTDVYPAVDTTDFTQSPTGTTKPYQIFQLANFIYGNLGYTVYLPVLAAATGNLTATYANGASGVGATLTNSGVQTAFTLDGQPGVLNGRYLISMQSIQQNNGIYILTNAGSATTNWVLTRSQDFNQAANIIDGGIVYVINGATYANTYWQDTFSGSIVVGTTAIVWTEFDFISSGFVNKIDGDTGEATPSGGVITISGGVTGLTTSGSSSTLDITGVLNLAHGGTNNDLTAFPGGIVWSDASKLNILAGTITASQVLLSGDDATPEWSTATYPATTTINQLLYSSSANIIAGLATLDNGVLITGTTGIPAMLANSGTPGYVLTANSGAPPSWQAITAEGAITTIDGDSGSATPSGGVITISGGSTGLTTSGSSHTLDLTGTLNLASGGTNHALTASAGGIVWSDASKLNILAGTATAGQLLLSGNAATPSWLSSTDYGILYCNSSGAAAWLANGTTGQVLTATTSGNPSWGAGGNGAWVKISSQTASNSASITFSSLTSTYQAYAVVLTNVVPATNNASMLLTYNSITSNYEYTTTAVDTFGNYNEVHNNSAAAVNLSSGLANTAGIGMSGFLYMYAPDTAVQQFVNIMGVGYLDTDVYAHIFGAGSNTGTTAVTSITFAMSSGNISTGGFELYGIVA